MFFDGEPWDADDSLEFILKKKQNRNNEPSIIQSSIYFPCVCVSIVVLYISNDKPFKSNCFSYIAELP